MRKHDPGIPISLSMQPLLTQEDMRVSPEKEKARIFFLSLVAILIADVMCFIARFLVGLIDVLVNLFYFGRFSALHVTPASSGLGIWAIGIPALGGLIVGFMAYFGSKAIRGHGIPEAMEQILTNESKIKPSITILKPLSAAISIGSGGPFGAEGPIIATGGALGSSIGQLLRISADERKIETADSLGLVASARWAL